MRDFAKSSDVNFLFLSRRSFGRSSGVSPAPVRECRVGQVADEVEVSLHGLVIKV